MIYIFYVSLPYSCAVRIFSTYYIHAIDIASVFCYNPYCALYSCTCAIATYISLDANGETLVVKSVQSERPIRGCGALIGHSSNMYSTISIK
jgi:hypothetical protein